MGLTLHQHGHTHGEGNHHSHEENVNVRAAFIHVLGDFLQSFGVLVAALVIYYKVLCDYFMFVLPRISKTLNLL